MDEFIMGIDEAGRGPVIGPMVICGIMMKKESIPELTQMGVKDSKLLSPAKREKLKRSIEKVACRWELIKVPASKIDKHRISYLQVKSIIQLVDKFFPHTVIIDCPTCFPMSFKRKIKTLIKNKRVRLVVENFADKNYSIVSAASILAKLTRDQEIKNLSFIYPSIGSGYPSDKKTIEFLKKCVKENRQLPDIVRKRWKTVQNLIDNKEDQYE